MKILQFGTSRFLQAHADVFLYNCYGENCITVVQSSPHSGRAARLEALSADVGYPVKIRGLSQGKIVEENLQVKSIARTLSYNSEHDELLAAACDADMILSNVSEQGYVPTAFCKSRLPDPRKSYPAKLLDLLYNRYKRGAPPVVLVPTELFPRNGEMLRSRVLKLCAELWPDPEFELWLIRCTWVNCLVDRIVSEPIEPVGAVAEPYGMWAIEKQPGLPLGLEDEHIDLTTNLESYVHQKLFLLNLTHSMMAHVWHERGMPDDLTVLDYVNDEKLWREISEIVETETLSVFEANCQLEQAKSFWRATEERFRNPFLKHYLKDIFVGHETKLKTRAQGLIDFASRVQNPPQLVHVNNMLKSLQ